jgi:hypothetical protein
VPDPDEQRTLTLIRTLVASGANDSQVAGQLNVMSARPRRARWWNPGTVRSVRLYDAARRSQADLAALKAELRRRVRGES